MVFVKLMKLSSAAYKMYRKREFGTRQKQKRYIDKSAVPSNDGHVLFYRNEHEHKLVQ